MSEALTKAKLDRYERLLALGQPPPWWRFRAAKRWRASYAAIWAVHLDEVAMMLRAAYPLESLTELANRPSMSFAMLTMSAK